MRPLRFLLALVFALLTTPFVRAQTGCPGGTCTVTTCTPAAVQAAHTTAITGDIIQLPSGACNWASSISFSKSITLQGTGPALTTITPTNAGNPFIIQWTVPSGGVARLMHLKIDEGTGTPGTVIQFNGANNFSNVVIKNVDYNYRRAAANGGGGHSIIVYGLVGVFQFREMVINAFGAPIIVKHNSWNNVGHYGDNSWAAASTLGSAQAMYIEGSTFVCPNVPFYCNLTDSDSGARIVWRGNRFVNGAALTMHGSDTPGRSARGTRQWEYYFNRFHDMQFYAGPYGIRSGTGVAFDTTFTNMATGANSIGTNYQPGMNPPPNDSHAPYSPFGDCRVRAIASISCSGTTATITGAAVNLSYQFGAWVTIQGNSNSSYNGTFAVVGPALSNSPPHFYSSITAAVPACTGSGTGGVIRAPYNGMTATADGAVDYPCVDSIGRGGGTQIIDGEYSRPSGGAYGTLLRVVSPAGQAHEPVYAWNVFNNGTLIGWADNSGGSLAYNRDLFQQAGASCSGSSCTNGMGRGPFPPANCTANLGGLPAADPAWWDTDDATVNWNQETAADHALHDPTSAMHTQGQDGRLYKCTSTNTWTVAYTPYTFPHPLLSGAEPPPPGNQPPSASITSPNTTGSAGVTTATVDFGGGCTDDVACTAVAYTCAPACGSGSATLGTGTWAVTGASVPLGSSLWTFTPSDVEGMGTAVTITVLRRAPVTTLPYTDAHDATHAFPNLGPHYTLYGTTLTQFGLNGSGAGIINALAFGAAAFTGFVLNADQYMDVTVVDVAPLSKQVRLCFRTTGTAGQTSNLDAYFVQFDGTDSASNIIGRYDDGALTQNYTPSGLGAVTLVPGTTTVGGQVIGNTIQARVNGSPFGPVITTAGEYTTGTVANCSVGVGTRWDDTVVGNTSVPADTQDPVVAIDMPTTDPVFQIASDDNPVTVEAAVSDNVAVTSCILENSAAPGQTPLTPSGGRVSAMVTVVDGAPNNLTITCSDAATNQGSDTIQIVITQDPPGGQTRPGSLRRIF